MKKTCKGKIFYMELFTIIILMVLTLVLFLVIKITSAVLAIFLILLITEGFLLYRIVKRMKKTSSILEQGEEIIGGNLKHRIHLTDAGDYSELIVLINNLADKLQKEIIKNEESREARKRLLSNISHDIRTPLTSILGYVEALRDDLALSDKEKEKYYEIMHARAENLKEIIDEIFLMARIDAGDFEMDFQAQDLAEITRCCLIDFMPVIKKEGLETELIIPEKECLIYADRLAAERIIENVIKNSIEHGINGSFIGIELSAVDKGFLLSVRDKGPGIAEEDISYIFERLYKGDKTRSHSRSGSGLGLGIASRLIEKHRGRISVESVPGEETVFEVYFPGALRKS
ncbi:MAG TPA: HAMP domain-containing sensor histidine kinase [Halanaerobiales bacterium]|nr:HAMP domain-containing sensor histidine kinase [Halanaerobiales bacterium]